MLSAEVPLHALILYSCICSMKHGVTLDCDLVQIAPKEDELKLFQTWRGSLEELSPPERFLSSMATVPRLVTKINLLILVQQFDVRFPAMHTPDPLLQLPCVSTWVLH